MPQEYEYLVHIKSNGARFYYRDKKLHREIGPAVVMPNELQQYTNLGDEHLYKEVTDDKFGDAILEFTIEFGHVVLPIPLSEIDTLYTTSRYWIDGIAYSTKEFEAMLLNQKLEKELPLKNEDHKKVKV